jgi:hypothetical protein
MTVPLAVPNGVSALPLGHFLFTSESVGEGHPGSLRDTRPSADYFDRNT